MIYFVQEDPDGPIKIGCSTDPSRRLNTLQTGQPRSLELLAVLPGDRELEKQIHERCARFCIRGEWFEPAQELLDFIYENSTNRVEPQPDGTARLWFPRPLALREEAAFLVGTHRLKLLIDDEWARIYGIEGRPAVILDWLESMPGICEAALQQLRDALQ